MKKSLRYFTALLAIAVCGLFLVSLFHRGTAAEQKESGNSESSAQVSRSGGQVTLDKAAQERAGIQTQSLSEQTLHPEVLAYGRLEEDPSESLVLRSPVAGILQLQGEKALPRIGDRIAGETVIGVIEPRFTPTDRIALTSQLSTARSELNSSSAELAAARASYERLRTLNADRKNVSDRAVEEAQARVSEAEARRKSATETVNLLESSLQSSGPLEKKPLVMPRDGDVVELMAQPGEFIESGSVILRVTRLDRLLARIDVPVGQHIPATVSGARIIPTGFDDQVISAVKVGLNVAIDPKTQGQSYLFRLSENRIGLRPGLSVTAFISLPGASRKGVVVPHSAVVRASGKAYAYIRSESDRFIRKEVPTDNPVIGGYFVGTGFAPGQQVVTAGAQMLLSEEFKSQTEIEEEGS